MPVITDIQHQKRAATRYSVYLDNQYAFSLSDLELSTSGLRVGQSLTEVEVTSWQQQSAEGKAHHLALGYLSYRPRSQREVADYLARKGHSPEVADAVVTRLIDHDLVNDATFAASWIASRQALKPRSRHQLQQELLHKGISRDLIAQALADIGDDGQEQMLLDLVAKKRKLARYQDPRKLTQYLAHQGFSYDQIKKALTHPDD